MSAIAVVDTARSLDLIRRTVAKDCEPAEFDTFIHICRAVGLDPLRRQIYAFVFGKDNPSARRLSVVTAIDGYRAIAERTGNYRPDDRAPRIEYSEEAKDVSKNPLGIVRAEVTVYKHAHGAWFPVTGEAFWDEYAPIIETGEGGFEWVDLAANQKQLAIANHHVAVGQLHFAFAQRFDFPAFEHHAGFEAFFKKVVVCRFFIVGNAGGGLGFLGHQELGRARREIKGLPTIAGFAHLRF